MRHKTFKEFHFFNQAKTLNFQDLFDVEVKRILGNLMIFDGESEKLEKFRGNLGKIREVREIWGKFRRNFGEFRGYLEKLGEIWKN